MSGSVFTAAAGFLRGVGNQVAVSVAASAVAAALLAVPGGIAWPFFGSASGQGEAGQITGERWVSPVGSDGKIRARHHDADGTDAPLHGLDRPGLVSPAAIMMPMALDWAQSVAEVAALAKSTPTAEPRARMLQAQALPPRRPAIERAVVASTPAPRQIAPAEMQAAMNVPVAGSAPAVIDTARPPQRSVLGVTVPNPVSRVGDAVYGAVGFVGSAGIWTLSRASDLLPRL